MRRSTFRTYVHERSAMVDAAERGHLHTQYRHRGFAWHVVGLASADAS